MNNTFKVEGKMFFDETKNCNGLEISDNITKTISMFYYETVDKMLLENMPDDILLDLYKKVSNELKNRGLKEKK